MADRAFYNNVGTLENRVVHLYAKVTVGATGAPTLTSGNGIASIARNSAGNYTITFDDTYNEFLFAHFLVENAADQAPDTVGFVPKLDSHDVDASGGGTVTFAWQAADDGADVELANGTVFYAKFELRNSTLS